MRLDSLILLLGFLLAVLGDALFHDAGLGLNLPLWITALAGAGWMLRRRTGDRRRVLPWCIALGCFCAAALAWRASPFLRFWNGVALVAAGVLVGTALRRRLADAWPAEYARGALLVAGHVAGGAVAAGAKVIAGSGAHGSAVAARVRATGVGVALAVPVVFVFGGLLVPADPVLHAFVSGLFDWDPGRVVEHLVVIVLLGWLAAGWFRALTAPSPVAADGPAPPPRTLGLVELAIPLGALTVLFTVFTGVEARYLFGGEEVMRSAGLTYAEFARRGFFELVVATALIVPLLYAAQWALDRQRQAAVDGYRALVVVLALLVGLVMVSALARMRLYVAAYGLTEDRLYATAFMLWIAGVLGWFVVTEMRARPRRFATGAVLAGFGVMAALNVLNPDALIARTNLARAAAGRAVDAEYLSRLSPDAVPAVVAAWDELDAPVRCVLGDGLLDRVTPVEDWRAWTWAQARAARAVEALPAPRACAREAVTVP